MISFDKFVVRSGIELQSYFFANNITSDESLRQYCLANDFIPPEKSYFPKENEIADEIKEQKEEIKEQKEEALVDELPPAPTPKKKPARKPRTPRKRVSKTTKTTKNTKTKK